MSAVHIVFITLAAAAGVSTMVRSALVVYTVVIALNTGSARRRQVAVRVLRMLSPAMSVKLGRLAITLAQAEDMPEHRALGE